MASKLEALAHLVDPESIELLDSFIRMPKFDEKVRNAAIHALEEIQRREAHPQHFPHIFVRFPSTSGRGCHLFSFGFGGVWFRHAKTK